MPFVDLHQVAPAVIVEMRYAGSHNFIGHRIAGYRAPVCLLTRPAARALARVERDVRKRGYTLKVYDCYRPQRAVNEFIAWARRPADRLMQREFYPHVDKSRLFADGYIAARSGHSRGSTVDLTLVKRPPARQPRYRRGQRLVACTAPHGVRFRDNSLDMGTGYDCLDPRAHPFSPLVRGAPRRHRLYLRAAMDRRGFSGIPTEWWHFTLRGEPYPDTYYDVPVQFTG